MRDFWQEITYFHYVLPFMQKSLKSIVVIVLILHRKQLSSFKINIPGIIQSVPPATKLGISLIILPLMRILQRNFKRT